MNERSNPFKVGDKVKFDPDERTIGWTYSSFDRLRIHPGDIGMITRIVGDIVIIDDDRGGFELGMLQESGVMGRKKVASILGKCQAGP